MVVISTVAAYILGIPIGVILYITGKGGIRENGIISLEGECQIDNQVKLENFATAKVSTNDNEGKLELPFIYYPGYTVKFDGININTYETENGFYCPSCEMKLVGKTYSGYPCAKIDMPNDEPVKFCPRCGQAVKYE